MTPKRAKSDVHPCAFGRDDMVIPGMTIAEYAAIQFQAAALQGLMSNTDGTMAMMEKTSIAQCIEEVTRAALVELGYVEPD